MVHGQTSVYHQDFASPSTYHSNTHFSDSYATLATAGCESVCSPMFPNSEAASATGLENIAPPSCNVQGLGYHHHHHHHLQDNAQGQHPGQHHHSHQSQQQQQLNPHQHHQHQHTADGLSEAWPTYLHHTSSYVQSQAPFMPLQYYSSMVDVDATGGVGRLGSNGKPKRRRTATMAQRKAANIRERKRMFNLNEAFDILRKKVPTFAYEKRLSRIETLRLAITYISFMSDVVNGKDPDSVDLKELSERNWLSLQNMSEQMSDTE